MDPPDSTQKLPNELQYCLQVNFRLILACISMMSSKSDILYSASTEISQDVLSNDLHGMRSCQILTGLLPDSLISLTATFQN